MVNLSRNDLKLSPKQRLRLQLDFRVILRWGMSLATPLATAIVVVVAAC